MPSKSTSKSASKPSATPTPKDLTTLIDLTKTTQTLLSHFLSSLSPSAAASSTTTTSSDPPVNPLEILKPTTTLLKSHTTTLSLLLLTPPLSPTAIIKKIGDVSSSVLSAMVSAAASPAPSVGEIMDAELRAQVRRVLSGWGEVLGCLLSVAEKRKEEKEEANKGISESERNEILAATGVVWEACDALLKTCDEGIVGVVVRKAKEYREVLLDAIEELKEWSEEAEEEDEDGVVGSDDEDDVFGAPNRLGKGNEELRGILDKSVKRLKKVGMLYQALEKRRLKTFPKGTEAGDKVKMLDQLMALLKGIPEGVDDLASAFYDLDKDEAQTLLDKCCEDAKSAAGLVKNSWEGKEDEFTAWSAKWTEALEAS